MNAVSPAADSGTITPMQPAHAPRQHKTKRVSAMPLVRFMKDTGCSAAELSRVLEQADTTVAQWVSEDSMPAWATLAIEALVRRRSDTRRILMVRPGQLWDTVVTMLAAMNVEAKEFGF